MIKHDRDCSFADVPHCDTCGHYYWFNFWDFPGGTWECVCGPA